MKDVVKRKLRDSHEMVFLYNSNNRNAAWMIGYVTKFLPAEILNKQFCASTVYVFSSANTSENICATRSRILSKDGTTQPILASGLFVSFDLAQRAIV